MISSATQVQQSVLENVFKLDSFICDVFMVCRTLLLQW